MSMLLTSATDLMHVLWDAVGMEVSLLAFFCLGFLLFNSNLVHSRLGAKQAKGLAKELVSGNHAEVLASAQQAATLSLDAVLCVVQSFVENGRATELVGWLESTLPKAACLQTSDAARQVLEQVPSASASAVAGFFKGLGVETEELVAQAHAQQGDFQAVIKMLAAGAKVGPKTFNLLIKELLRTEDLAGAQQAMAQMQKQGLFVPAALTTQLMKIGQKQGQGAKALELLGALDLSSDGWTSLLEYCARTSPALCATALRMAEHKAAGDAVLKAFVKVGDPRAFEYFDKMAPTPQLCTQVALMCCEARNLPLAEHVLSTARMEGLQSVGLYSAVLKVYTGSRQFAKACQLYDQLLSDGLEPDTVLCGGLIKAAVECGRVDLSQQLLRKSGTLDIQNYMALFRTCAREKNCKKALQLLAELEESPVKADVVAYNCVLDVCVKCGDRRSAQALFAKMKGLKMVDVISFNTLLKTGGALDASQLLSEMRGLHLQPNQVTYNSLINAAVSRGDVAQAWAFLEEMEQQHIAIDNFTCSIMMKALKQSSAKEDVDRTLNLIERSHVHPDEVLVNTLLDACLRLKDVARLTTALNLFRKSGVVPAEPSYGTLIRAYGQAKCLGEARQLWEDMLRRNVRPSDGTFAGMVEACVANGALDEALGCVKAMQAAAPGFMTPVVTYTTLIKAFAQRQQYHHIVEVYDEMKASGVEMDLVLFNCLIDCFARVADMERTATLFRDMCAQGVAPDLITYSTVIKGYCVAGDLEQAIQLFTLMRKRGIVPDAVVFNALLDGCARKGMPPLAEQVLKDMEASGVAPSNTTLTILVKLYGKHHDIDMALKIVDEVPAKHGFQANTQVLTCLVAACLNNGRAPLAFEIFDRMQSPDGKAYATLATGCLKNQDMDGAVGTLEQALRRGQALDQELIDSVVTVAKRRCKDRLKPLIASLHQHGYTTPQ